MNLLLLFLTAMNIASGTKDYVRVEIQPAKLVVSNGIAASLHVRLLAADDIHVNSQPPVTVKSETAGVTFAVKELPASGDYLDLDKPLKVVCRVDGMQPGEHRVGIVVGYTYCSETEKWCRIGNDSSSVVILVKK